MCYKHSDKSATRDTPLIEKIPYILFYLFGGLFIVIATWENFLPRRKYSAPFLRRWYVNGALLIANTVAMRWLLPVTTVIFAVHVEQNNWGLLHFLSVPLWLNVLITFILLDLIRYWFHRVLHWMPVLWRFHRVHHADPDYDLTTGLRFHPGEALIVGAVNLLMVAGIGVAPLAVAITEAGVLFNSFFTHGNVKMPDWLDQSLRTVIVTPDMHRVHHSIDLIEANQNFASIFSFWDRIFGSYTEQPALGHTGMGIGLSDVGQEDGLSLWNQLYMPFARQPNTGS